jgi:Arm DNA-binding domain
MGTSYRLRIGLREIAAIQPHTILWDIETRGFCARRQFSTVITYSVYFRTRDGQQRFYKIGRHGVFTPTQARDEAKQVLRNVAVGKDPGAELKALRSAPTVEWLCDEYVSDMQSGKVNGKKLSTAESMTGGFPPTLQLLLRSLSLMPKKDEKSSCFLVLELEKQVYKSQLWEIPAMDSAGRGHH